VEDRSLTLIGRDDDVTKGDGPLSRHRSATNKKRRKNKRRNIFLKRKKEK
jgi:hypothetical protein